MSQCKIRLLLGILSDRFDYHNHFNLTFWEVKVWKFSIILKLLDLTKLSSSWQNQYRFIQKFSYYHRKSNPFNLGKYIASSIWMFNPYQNHVSEQLLSKERWGDFLFLLLGNFRNSFWHLNCSYTNLLTDRQMVSIFKLVYCSNKT